MRQHFATLKKNPPEVYFFECLTSISFDYNCLLFLWWCCCCGCNAREITTPIWSLRPNVFMNLIGILTFHSRIVMNFCAFHCIADELLVVMEFAVNANWKRHACMQRCRPFAIAAHREQNAHQDKHKNRIHLYLVRLFGCDALFSVSFSISLLRRM